MSDLRPSPLATDLAGHRLTHSIRRLSDAAKLLRKRVKNESFNGAVVEFLRPVFRAVPEDLDIDLAAEDDFLRRLRAGQGDSLRWSAESGSEHSRTSCEATSAFLLALLRVPALRGFWERELRRERFERLRAKLPEAWFADGRELPPGGALPGLGIARWADFFRVRPHNRLVLVRLGGGRPAEAELLTAADGGPALARRIREVAAEFSNRPAIVIAAGSLDDELRRRSQLDG